MSKKLHDTTKGSWIEVDAVQISPGSERIESSEDIKIYWNKENQILVRRYTTEPGGHRYYTEIVTVFTEAQIQLNPQAE